MKPHHKQVMDFSFALLKPFASCAEGVRVPDIYSFPTSVYHLHGTTTLKSNTSGQCGFIHLPNPLLSFIDTGSDTAGTQSVGSTSLSNIASNSILYGASTPAALSAVYSTFRVCSVGVRILNLQAPLSATGKFYVALAPSPATVPSYQAATEFNTIGASYATNTCTGNPSLFTSEIMSLPTGRSMTVTELMNGGLDIVLTPVHPIFYEFKNACLSTKINGTNFLGSDAFSGTTGLSQNSSGSGAIEATQCTGGVSVFFFAEGLPVSINCFDVEYIYHLEGTPPVLSGTTGYNVPIASGSMPTNIGSSATVESALQVVNSQPKVNWLDVAKDLATTAGDAVNQIAGFVESPTGRAIMSGIALLL